MALLVLRDASLQAPWIVFLTPTELARVAQTCRAARECTGVPYYWERYLSRLGIDLERDAPGAEAREAVKLLALARQAVTVRSYR